MSCELNFLIPEKKRSPSARRSRKLESLPKQSDQKPVEVGSERAMRISPFIPPVDDAASVKDSDFEIVPVTTTFLSSSKPDGPPCTRVIISRNLADEFNKKGKKPLVDHLFGKEKAVAVFVPGDVSQKQIIEFEVLLAQRVAKATRKGIKERLAYGKGPVLESDIALFRLAAEKKRINSLMMVAEKESFTTGRSNKNSNVEDDQTLPHLSTTLAANRERRLGDYEVPHIVEEILVRSPVQSLARFKLTCKSWNSLLSEQSFVYKQLEFGQKRFLHARRSQVWELDPVAQRSCYLKIREFEKEILRDLVECNGLLLCSTMSKRIVIWNRAQTRWIDRDNLSLYDTYTLGHDGNNLYKLMKFNFGSYDLDGREFYEPEAEVYEFSSNSWRGIDMVGDWSALPSMMVSVDGNSYWLASSNKVEVFIQSFDFSTESFRAIQLPTTPLSSDMTFSLSSFGGTGVSLMFYHLRELKIQVWIAKQARDQTTVWEKFFEVTRHHLPMVPGQSFFMKNRMIVMFYEVVSEDGRGHIRVFTVSRDGIQHQMQTETFRHFPSSISCVYSPSLVSVPF